MCSLSPLLVSNECGSISLLRSAFPVLHRCYISSRTWSLLLCRKQIIDFVLCWRSCFLFMWAFTIWGLLSWSSLIMTRNTTIEISFKILFKLVIFSATGFIRRNICRIIEWVVSTIAFRRRFLVNVHTDLLYGALGHFLCFLLTLHVLLDLAFHISFRVFSVHFLLMGSFLDILNSFSYNFSLFVLLNVVIINLRALTEHLNSMLVGDLMLQSVMSMALGWRSTPHLGLCNRRFLRRMRVMAMHFILFQIKIYDKDCK